VKEKKPSLASILSHGRLLDSAGDNLIVGIKGTSFQMDQVEKRENKGLIEQVAAEVLARKVGLTFQLLVDEAKHGTMKGPVSKKSTPEPPDPAVQDVLKVFGGEVIEQDGSET
jgi:hypothetical protein